MLHLSDLLHDFVDIFHENIRKAWQIPTLKVGSATLLP